MFKRIISFVLVIAIVFCFAVPSAFAITEYYSKATNIFDMWFTYLYNNADDVWDEDSPLPWFGTAIKGITTALNSKICQESHDGYHASLAKFVPDEAFGIDDHGRYALLICEYCGDYFRCYSSDLIAAHDEYVASLDSTIANSIEKITGFTATAFDSVAFFDFLGSACIKYPSEMTTLIRDLGINKHVFIYSISTTVMYGLFFDENGILSYDEFKPFSDVPHLSEFGVYKLSDLTSKDGSASHVPQYKGSYYYDYSYPVFYSKAVAEAYCNSSDEAYTDYYSNVILALHDGYDFGGGDPSTNYNVPRAAVWVKGGGGLSWSDDYDIYYLVAPDASQTPDVDSITWNIGNVVTQPTGTDSTSRTCSLMQTINNYNVDNSVVDNSSNVNYYISPKNYVTELPDDTIDIEQCYSPQSYDEETLVFTEPVTGAQILSSGWTYNYETRTYDIAVPAGTATDTLGSDVTRIELIYGDEAVTYNYYLADDTLAQSDEYAYVMVSGDETFGTGGSSGDDNTGDDSTGDAEEETHKHSYTDTVTTEPTCEAPGIRKYTCDECGDSYTEKIDAAGHTWTVKQAVATQYDDTGAVIVQGYTIYKCSVCNTEYKDEAGTGPPNNSADNTDGEGIFKKIGQLLGSILSGLLGMIEAVLGGLLDGLVRLANLVGDKLTQVVEIVTGLFDKIPQLFGGFTALLGDVFVFIPEDIMTIFTFGAAAIVFVGILMLFIKR